jgi:hypothetical protein
MSPLGKECAVHITLQCTIVHACDLTYNWCIVGLMRHLHPKAHTGRVPQSKRFPCPVLFDAAAHNRSQLPFITKCDDVRMTLGSKQPLVYFVFATTRVRDLSVYDESRICLVEVSRAISKLNVMRTERNDRM